MYSGPAFATDDQSHCDECLTELVSNEASLIAPFERRLRTSCSSAGIRIDDPPCIQNHTTSIEETVLVALPLSYASVEEDAAGFEPATNGLM
jgi:hypothetical protein